MNSSFVMSLFLNVLLLVSVWVEVHLLACGRAWAWPWGRSRGHVLPVDAGGKAALLDPPSTHNRSRVSGGQCLLHT